VRAVRMRSTKGRWCVAISWLALVAAGFGQVSEGSLRALYGKPVAGSYVVRPGVTITAIEGPKGEVCVLTISGPKTEEDLIAVIDKAVPPASRGLALGSLSECMGICRTTRNYEKVTIYSTVLAGGQLDNPAAIVTFKSKSCEARVKGFLASPKTPTADRTN